MIRTFIAASILIASVGAFATTAAEEALILNQELQFLEDSVSNMAAAPTKTAETKVNSAEGENDSSSLERTYFSDEERDVIKTKKAAPKRRSF